MASQKRCVFQKFALMLKWFLLPGLLGQEGLAGFEGIGEIEILDTRAICQTPSSYHIEIHADSCSCAVSDSCKKIEDVRGEPGSPAAAPTEA